jgi:transposase
MTFLNFPHYTYSIIEKNDHNIYIELIPDSSTKPICSKCNNKELQLFGKRKLKFIDIPIQDKCVKLNIEIQRYRCKNCKKIIQSELPFMSDTYRMTERLVLYIIKESILRPFTHLAEEIGVTEGTIRKIFNDHKKHFPRS